MVSPATFFKDFAEVFGKLIALGTKVAGSSGSPSAKERASLEFRELAMHGSEGPLRAVAKEADIHGKESSSLRTALHKVIHFVLL